MSRKSIYEFAKEYKQALLTHEKGVAKDLVSAYGKSYLEIQKALQDLSQKMQAARDRGEKVRLTWLRERDRLASFLSQVESQIDRFANSADVLISNGQQWMVDAASRYSKEAATLGMREAGRAVVGNTWNRVPQEALEALVGTLQDGSPLKTLLDGLAPEAKGMADKVLTHAVINGTGPRQTATEMRKELGVNLDRALTISRTEQLRASRTATIEGYRANSDIIDGWTRIETLDDSTCIICIAEHGRVYTLEEEFESHPNCRGTMVPNIIRQPKTIETGEEQFAKWSDERQLATLGPEKYEAYKSGKVKLYDFVERTYNEDWGGGRKVRPLEEALKVSAPEPVFDLTISRYNFDTETTEKLHELFGKDTELTLRTSTYPSLHGTEEAAKKELLRQDKISRYNDVASKAVRPDVKPKTAEDLQWYQGKRGYGIINRVMRGGVEGDRAGYDAMLNPSNMKRASKAVERIVELQDESKVGSDLILYRGLRSTQEFSPGEIVQFDGFASTSLSNSVATEFAGSGNSATGPGTIWEIRAGRETRGIFMDRAVLGKDSTEYEVLLHPDTKYRYLGSHEEKHPISRERIIRHIMEVANEETD